MKHALVLLLLTTTSALAQQNPSFNLANKSPQPIAQVFVTPAGDANWGQNRLTSGPIAPGASFAVRRKVDGNCVFDLRVVYADKTREEKRTVNTCTADDIAFGGAAAPKAAAATDNPGFHLVNHDKLAIAELYAGPAGKARGANLLDKGALPPDASMDIKLPASQGCSTTLEIVFADKSSKKRTADTCRIKDITVP